MRGVEGEEMGAAWAQWHRRETTWQSLSDVRTLDPYGGKDVGFVGSRKERLTVW